MVELKDRDTRATETEGTWAEMWGEDAQERLTDQHPLQPARPLGELPSFLQLR